MEIQIEKVISEYIGITEKDSVTFEIYPDPMCQDTFAVKPIFSEKDERSKHNKSNDGFIVYPFPSDMSLDEIIMTRVEEVEFESWPPTSSNSW